MKKTLFPLLTVFLLCFFVRPLHAQTHVSVPLTSNIYDILEAAELRGLCAPLPSVRPYSRALVIRTIDEILSKEKGLSAFERKIIADVRTSLLPPEENGFRLGEGKYYVKSDTAKTKIPFSLNFDFSADVLASASLLGDMQWAGEFWIAVDVNGDLSEYVSYSANVAGGLIRNTRSKLGQYNTYYLGYLDPDPAAHNVNQLIDVYNDTDAYFPYSYRKRWDSSLMALTNVSSSGLIGWPNGISIGWTTLPEISAGFWDEALTVRLGKVSRDWSAGGHGSSVTFNQNAQPFYAFELSATPVPWLTFSSLTGILEFDSRVANNESSFQNAFSIYMTEINIKNYFHIDIGSTAVWPKRYEIGYAFPLLDKYLYQNNIGDHDNLAMFGDLRGGYPGIFSLWASLYADEVNPKDIAKLFSLDRQMFAFQAGGKFFIPFVPFATITASYTKIEPYVYTHTRNFAPWYNKDTPMETNYVSDGVSLGHYLPPNSDEVLVRFNTVLGLNRSVHLQYQMVRHGADYGSNAVDGSNLHSELDPEGRSDKPVLRKHFLKDGAYQWQHIIKLGGEWSFAEKERFLPFSIYAEAGAVFSYFTNIDGLANTGEASSYKVIDTTEYPKKTNIIITLGMRFFPK